MGGRRRSGARGRSRSCGRTSGSPRSLVHAGVSLFRVRRPADKRGGVHHRRPDLARNMGHAVSDWSRQHSRGAHRRGTYCKARPARCGADLRAHGQAPARVACPSLGEIPMTRGLAIVGHGKMGRLIEQLAPEYGFEVRLTLKSGTNARGAGLTGENLRGVDAAVEFSTPSAAVQNIRQLAALGIPVVAGTTGWSQELACVRDAVQSCGGALVWGPNFSVGGYPLRQVIAQAATGFAADREYQAWGWEIHHAMKRDAPSGTLLGLAQEMKQAGF